MNVLSLCDGMSCGQIALKQLGIPIDHYYASEIDKSAIKVTMDNFPDTIQLGDVTNITIDTLRQLPKIDIVMFGSPCRSLSKVTAGREQYNNGLKGVSGLFYPCNDILQWIKKNNNTTVKFLVENVDSDKSSDIDKISELLGVEPILINSNLFSAQDRKRYYWTNIQINQLPTESSLVLKDIMDSEVPEKFYYNREFTYNGDEKRVCATLNIKGHDIMKRVYNKNYKCPTLTSCRGGNLQKKVYDNGRCRKLTPNEYRKLQTIPDWYKMDVSDSAIYNLCGDGWTINVITHILKSMLETKTETDELKKIGEQKTIKDSRVVLYEAG